MVWFCHSSRVAVRNQAADQDGGCQSEGQVHSHGDRHQVSAIFGITGLQDSIDDQDRQPQDGTDTDHGPWQFALARKPFGQAGKQTRLRCWKFLPPNATLGVAMQECQN